MNWSTTATMSPLAYTIERWDNRVVVVHRLGELTTASDLNIPSIAVALADFPVLTNDTNALPRPAQLDELARLSVAGRIKTSGRERARFGWRDAPRRPCFRGVRLR